MHQAGDGHPPGHAEHEDHEARAGAPQGGEQQQHHDAGEGEREVGEAQQGDADRAAAIPRHRPDRRADGEGQQHREEPNAQRDARAIDQPGPYVPPEPVGAQEVERVVREMDMLGMRTGFARFVHRLTQGSPGVVSLVLQAVKARLQINPADLDLRTG